MDSHIVLDAAKRTDKGQHRALYTSTKKVKEHCPAGSASVVLPSCCFTLKYTQALIFIELPVDNVKNQGFNVSLAVHPFIRNSL
jgi:hypothetical protein